MPSYFLGTFTEYPCFNTDKTEKTVTTESIIAITLVTVLSVGT